MVVVRSVRAHGAVQLLSDVGCGPLVVLWWSGLSGAHVVVLVCAAVACGAGHSGAVVS